MNRKPALFVLAAGLIATGIPAGAAAADVHKIDPVHSAVIFRVMHLGIGATFGWFRQVSGSFTLDAKAPQQSKVELVVDAASVYTGDKKRDAHLQSPDFFNVKQYPKITFKSTKVSRSGKQWKITGKLDLHGVVRPVTVAMAQIGEGKDPWGAYRVGFEGSFELKRSEFGMTKVLGPAGDEVRIMLAFEGVKQ